jgi:hypothetical protein
MRVMLMKIFSVVGCGTRHRPHDIAGVIHCQFPSGLFAGGLLMEHLLEHLDRSTDSQQRFGDLRSAVIQLLELLSPSLVFGSQLFQAALKLFVHSEFSGNG